MCGFFSFTLFYRGRNSRCCTRTKFCQQSIHNKKGKSGFLGHKHLNIYQKSTVDASVGFVSCLTTVLFYVGIDLWLHLCVSDSACSSTSPSKKQHNLSAYSTRTVWKPSTRAEKWADTRPGPCSSEMHLFSLIKCDI